MQSIGIWLIVGAMMVLPVQETKPVQDVGKTVTKAEDRTYATAFAEAQAAQRPLVVVVTATWCPPCQVLKNKVINPLEAKKGFDNVILAYVDMDKEPALAKQLIGGQGIPQLIVFEKNQDKWVKRNLSGFQELATVQDFIKPQFSGDASTLRLADNLSGQVQR
ncbi:MAG: thioredoxin family protein [Planctomycetaceae bacterium]|nr:thioredoxin family protein [Planctomycetaceae bacterium]